MAAQQFKFNHYTAEKGLPQQYVYDIEQNKSGYLWIATSEGLVKFDGDAFEVFDTKNGLAEDFTTHLFVASDGAMWLGHNQGGVSKIADKGFKKMVTSVGEFGAIVGFDETRDHKIIAAGQSGKILISGGKADEVYDLAGGNYLVYTMCISAFDYILLGTEAGVVSYRLKKSGPVISSQKKIAGIPEEKIQCIARSNIRNVFWVATVTGEIYKLHEKAEGEITAEKYNTDWKVALNGIQSIFEDADGNLWISTYDGVVKMMPAADMLSHNHANTYKQANGLPGDQVKCTFQDRENNVWFGMYGSGLAMLKDEFFTFYNHQDITSVGSTRSILIGKTSKWFGTDNGLIRSDPALAEKWKLYNATNGLVNEPITSLRFFREYVLAGTSRSGLFCYDRVTDKWKNIFVSGEDNLANAILDVEVTENTIWLGTRGGLFELNSEFEVIRSFNTESGLTHNSINDLFVDKDGKLWICTQGNMVATIANGAIELVEITGPSQSINITCITQDLHGVIWVGTYGSGVFKQKGKEFVGVTALKNGLASDYCYFIRSGKNDDIWVGHRGALSRIDSKTQRIVVFNDGDGIDCDFNELASFKDDNGHLWFGSNKGTVKFDPRKYVTNQVQPMVNIKSIIFSDKEMDLTGTIELPYNNYRMVINFIGINFTNPEKVKYKYKLKGFDLAWSDVTKISQAYYPKLSDGEYEFVVKACNDDGIFGDAGATVKIIVASPYWKRWWFFVICFAALVSMIIILIKLRERNQKKIRLYLERQLQLRTRELVEQKSLVEEKNKDITDSINYAHKIQSGILPSIREIKQHLPDCFVMYKPRDIVSGDFYWYSVKESIISIAVADCTGHGVPGAFMSMIGSTIFKEVNKEITDANPAMFIEYVDERVAALMNPDRKTQFQDGMDMILIEFDTKTGHVVFAGAARPLLQIKRDGTSIVHKTSSDSIGGHNLSKNFTNHHIKLDKGDAVYLYSDGIVDQFGGPTGKKIMTSGLITLLTESLHLDMQEQGYHLDRSFENWKGEEYQIDDVLIVGIRY